MNNIQQFDPLHKIFEDGKDGTGLKKSIQLGYDDIKFCKSFKAEDPKSPMKV